MTYREQLNKVQELGISIVDLDIANEFDCVLEFECADNDFEKLCSFGVNIYLKAEHLTANAIALCINDLIVEGNKTIDEVISMNKWSFINEASYWL